MKTEQEFIKDFLYLTLKEYEDHNTSLGYSGAMSGFYDLRPLQDIMEICARTNYMVLPNSYIEAYKKFKKNYIQKEKDDLQQFERLSEKYNKDLSKDKIETVKHNIQKLEEPKIEYVFCPKCGSNHINIQKEHKIEILDNGDNWSMCNAFNNPYHLSCYSCGSFAQLYYEMIHHDENGYFITKELI